MKITDLQGKMIAVTGYGMEGKAVTNYLLKHGIKPVLFDTKPWEAWSKEDQEEIKQREINFIFGPDCFKELKGFEIAFRSPGIRLKDLKIENLKITSQTKWFFEHCPAKIIGVTGTKGKGTTSSLIWEILNANEKKAFLTGNIGKVSPLEILDDLTADDWVVYELSSFQLQDLEKSPHIGVVLMVTSEHLDYHKDTQEYVQAKEAIVKYQTPQDFAVINADFPSSVKIGELSPGEKFYFSRKKEVNHGCFVKDGAIVGPKPDGSLIEIIKIKDLQLKGAHNLENVCAAIEVARAAGCKMEPTRQAIRDFKGLEHRLEFVAEKNGIKFYNDSFSTTPETAVAAIQSFSEPLVVILGGSSKNSDFSELGKTIREASNINTLIIIGDEAPKIQASIGKSSIKILTGAKNMAEIFGQVRSVAQSGDVVLLSPACASYGMFKNYKDRGEQFKRYVDSHKV